VVRPWEALIIGIIGGLIAIGAAELIERLKIDDPVSAVSVHGACGIWVGTYARYYRNMFYEK